MSSQNGFDSQWWDCFWQLGGRGKNRFHLWHRPASSMNVIDGKLRRAPRCHFFPDNWPIPMKEWKLHSSQRSWGGRVVWWGMEKANRGDQILSRRNSIHALFCPDISVLRRTQSGSSKWLSSSHQSNLKRQLQLKKAASAGQSESDRGWHSPHWRQWWVGRV